MSPLTVQQVAQAASSAGFKGDAVIMAVAIAKRESGWDPAAIGDKNNPAPGHRSIGLMQINVGPTYNNKGIWFRENEQLLFDPVNNMKAAFEMSGGGTNWRAWTTYRAGIPAPDLEGVRAQLAGVDLGATTVGLEDLVPGAGAVGDLADLGKFFGNLTKWETWRRVLQLGAGVLLMGWGASAIANDAIRSVLPIPSPKAAVKKAAGAKVGVPDTGPGDDQADDQEAAE